MKLDKDFTPSPVLRMTMNLKSPSPQKRNTSDPSTILDEIIAKGTQISLTKLLRPTSGSSAKNVII